MPAPVQLSSRINDNYPISAVEVSTDLPVKMENMGTDARIQNLRIERMPADGLPGVSSDKFQKVQVVRIVLTITDPAVMKAVRERAASEEGFSAISIQSILPELPIVIKNDPGLKIEPVIVDRDDEVVPTTPWYKSDAMFTAATLVTLAAVSYIACQYLGVNGDNVPGPTPTPTPSPMPTPSCVLPGCLLPQPSTGQAVLDKFNAFNQQVVVENADDASFLSEVMGYKA